MNVTEALVELAHASEHLGAFRGGALALARDALGADVGMFVTALPSQPLAITTVGFGEEARALFEGRWERYGGDARAVKAEAARAGAATDVRTLGAALYRTRLYRELMGPLGGSESLFVVPRLAGRAAGLVMIGRLGGRFSDGDLSLARSLAPGLAVGTVALGALERVEPRAEGLSAAERDLVGYLELGYTTKEIALARGTSPSTVQNQLSQLYRKLGVSNRTEAVGLRAR